MVATKTNRCSCDIKSVLVSQFKLNQVKAILHRGGALWPPLELLTTALRWKKVDSVHLGNKLNVSLNQQVLGIGGTLEGLRFSFIRLNFGLAILP